MKDSEQEKILRAVLADENLERLRETSLVRGLRAARGHRWRRSFAGVATAFLVATTVFVAWPRQEIHRETNSAPPSRVSARVKMINDEQLLAVLSDRAVALVGRGRDQHLVFLDQDVPSKSQR
jgi:hypothetical protein